MRQHYEKPSLVRAAALSKIAAVDTCPSGYVLVPGDGGDVCEIPDEGQAAS